MVELKYPIGIQTFSNIVEDGCTYADQTQFIPKFVKQANLFFELPAKLRQ